jgi:hypothetical protein
VIFREEHCDWLRIAICSSADYLPFDWISLVQRVEQFPELKQLVEGGFWKENIKVDSLITSCPQGVLPLKEKLMLTILNQFQVIDSTVEIVLVASQGRIEPSSYFLLISDAIKGDPPIEDQELG